MNFGFYFTLIGFTCGFLSFWPSERIRFIKSFRDITFSSYFTSGFFLISLVGGIFLSFDASFVFFLNEVDCFFCTFATLFNNSSKFSGLALLIKSWKCTYLWLLSAETSNPRIMTGSVCEKKSRVTLPSSMNFLWTARSLRIESSIISDSLAELGQILRTFLSAFRTMFDSLLFFLLLICKPSLYNEH